MKEITLVDQVMDSLAFEVEEVPQDGQISSASSNSPLNVKIRIRKKNRKVLPNGGIISIPKNDHTAYDGEKVRVTSSDQTIMSFNVLMDRGQFIKKRPPKQKRIMQLFKRGGCLGVQNDEDQYEYSIITPQQSHKENESPETMKSLSKEGLDKANFTLAKNYSNTEVLQANKHKHTDFLGKCKPGGCLDPPYGEDKYPYLPKLMDVDETETKTKINECECKENPPANNKIKSSDEDKNNNSPLVEKENTVPINDSTTFLAQIKSSNSIITFPSILLSTEALNKLPIQKRTKSHSSSRESKSYTLSNQLLETYYISPKVKTIDQEPKSATDTKPNLDTKNVDIFSMKGQENVLHDYKPEPYINSDIELNKEVEHGGRIALLLTKDKIITNDIMNNITEGDKTVLLKDQENGMETPRTPLMEKHETAVINVMPESCPLNTHDSTIFFDKEKIDNDKKYLDKLDTIPESNLQEMPKKNEDSALMSENSTIIALAHDLTEEIKSATELPLNKNDQDRIDDFYANKTKSVESDELKSKSDMETISLPQDYSSNNETLNAIDVNTEVVPKENETIVTKSSIENETIVTKSSSIVDNNKISIERMIEPTQDLLYEDLPIKEYDRKVSSSNEQDKKDTSNLDILSYSKNIRDDTAKSDLPIDKKFVPQKNSFSNEDLNTKAIDVNSLQEFLSFIEPTESTKNKMKFPQEDDSLDSQALNVIETAENANFIEADQPTVLISKDSEDKLMGLVDKYDNKIEDYEQDSIKTEVSAEKKSFEELKSNTIVPTSPMSINESVMEEQYSNSITKLSFQNDKDEKDDIKIESFHTNKSDTINSYDRPQQGYQDTSNINSVTNSQNSSETHIDVSYVDGDKINKENLKLAEKTDLQDIEDQKKSKGGILHDEIYHKDLEVTFSDKIRTDSMRISQNILNKPTYETEIPVDIELEQSRDKAWDTKENFNTEEPIPSDVTVSKEKQKDLNESLPMNYDDKGVIYLNMAFQSFETDEDGSVIRTLDFSSISNSNRYPNDNILQFKTIIRPNDGEIKIPIDSDKDLVLQIKTDDKYKSRHDGSMKTFPNFNMPKSIKYESNLLNGDNDNDRGHLLQGNNSAIKDTSTVTQNNEINLQQTLDDVYKDKLLPLHDIIKKLKRDIDELTKQQTLIKEKIYNAKRVQSNPIYTSGKRCGCIEMLFT